MLWDIRLLRCLSGDPRHGPHLLGAEGFQVCSVLCWRWGAAGPNVMLRRSVISILQLPNLSSCFGVVQHCERAELSAAFFQSCSLIVIASCCIAGGGFIFALLFSQQTPFTSLRCSLLCTCHCCRLTWLVGMFFHCHTPSM